jgi:hypothetical protein
MPLEIVEILGRSDQGRTRPYVCRGDDGEVYFVKGGSATRQGLVAEWLCAEMAFQLGLPVAPYAIGMVPEELIEADLSGWLGELGAGAIFASRRVQAVELTDMHRDHVDRELRRDILAFDWWIRNGDRSLTTSGGNPNLLWNPAGDGSLVVIDHNLAFDASFSAKDFADTHVFSDELPALFSDFVAGQAYVERFQKALLAWESSCAKLPVDWRYVDPERTIPVDFNVADFRAILDRATEAYFWNLTP